MGSLKGAYPEGMLNELKTKYQLKDPWAAECATSLAKRLGCIGTLCTFSKMTIDVNKHLTSVNLYHGFDQEEFGESISRSQIISVLYGVYYTVVREVIETVEPKYHISVHTKKKLSAPGRDLEIHHYQHNPLASRLVSELAKKSISAECNESEEFEAGAGRAMELFRYPRPGLVGFRVDFREAAVEDPEKRERLVAGLSDAIGSVLVP